jgi:hypothetical protein
MARPHSADMYQVAVAQRGRIPGRWEWEIFRHGKPLGVRLCEGNFGSEATALALGKVALREFLEALARDQNA